MSELGIAECFGMNIFEAASLGKLAQVKELVQSDPGCVYAISKEGFPALGLAAYPGHKEVVQFPPRERCRSQLRGQRNRVHCAYRCTGEWTQRNRGPLVSKGANVNHRYEEGFSPLMIAAEGGDVQIAKVLLANGADVNARRKDGKTPLSIAIEKGHDEVVALFKRHGAHE